VARRHGLTPPQLFTWRRSARRRLEAETPPAFVPAVVVAPEPPAARAPECRPERRAPRRPTAAIELEASGVTVRIGDGVSPATGSSLRAHRRPELIQLAFGENAPWECTLPE
jgi:transposase